MAFTTSAAFSSTLSLATAILAKRLGMMAFATTRNPAKAEALTAIGVDHVLLDDGNIADHVTAITPNGVDTTLELVGTPTLPDTLRTTRIHGVVCFTVMLANQWTVRDFLPHRLHPLRSTSYRLRRGSY